MTDQVRLSEAAFERLLKHLVHMEERKESLVRMYRDDYLFRGQITLYIRELDNLIRHIAVTPDGGESLPFVVIGCDVEVEVVPGRGLYTVQIVPPLDSDESEGRLSYLSSAGRRLLLKRIGDEVVFETSAGICRCVIRSVRIVESVV